MLTLAVLPAIWLINREDDTTTPNVAAVGLSTESAQATTTTTTQPDFMGSIPPRYLNGTSDSIPQSTSVTVGVGQEDTLVVGTGRATYRSAIDRRGVCLTDLVEPAVPVTVVNIDNGREFECVTEPLTQDDGEVAAGQEMTAEVVLFTTDFSQLADLTDAPVPIEIRR